MNKSGFIASALLYSLVSVTQPALAEPQGGEVRAGSATIQQTLGTTIRQLTDKANDGELVAAGELVEENGQVQLVGSEGLVLQAGTIQAGSVETDSSQLTVLSAGSSTRASEARVLGQNVVVNGLVDASAAGGGGRVLVGGNLGGDGPERKALTTRIGEQAEVRADALTEGEGGTIVVWADERTDMLGSLSAVGAGGPA